MAPKPVKYSVVDAFSETAFKGNPAAVCFLEEDKDKSWMQSVASEFNISQTCFLTLLSLSPIPRFHLRWFTPVDELGCGYLFGLPLGIIVDSIGSTSGATAAFILGRTIGRSYVNSQMKSLPSSTSNIQTHVENND